MAVWIAAGAVCALLALAVLVAPAQAPAHDGMESASPSPAVTELAQESESPSPAASPTEAPGAESDVPGDQLFAANCAGCHGPRGEGRGEDGPSLKAAAFADIVEEKVRVGGGGMPAFGGSLPSRIGEVSRYVAEEIADTDARLATVSEGGDSYRLYCAACHGATGRGGALSEGNAPSFEDMPAANALAAMLIGPGQMPPFDEAFDTRKQAAVSRYVQVLVSPPSPGGDGLGFFGPVAEGFVALGALIVMVFVAGWLSMGKGDKGDG